MAPGPVSGAGLAVVALAAHFGVAQRSRAKAFERRLRELSGDIEILHGEVESTRADLDTLRMRLDDMPDAEKLSSELKVLGGLLKQLSVKKEAAVSGRALAPPEAKAGGSVGGGSVGGGSASAWAGPETRRPGVPSVVLGEAQLLEAIERGLREEKVDLYLQPVVSLPQRKRRFYECYSRIMTEGVGLITPEQYIPGPSAPAWSPPSTTCCWCAASKSFGGRAATSRTSASSATSRAPRWPTRIFSRISSRSWRRTGNSPRR